MLIVANWKAYIEDFEKAKKLFAISKKLMRTIDCNIVLAPPAPLLGALAFRNKSKIAFAAQDVSATTGGAETGEATVQAFATVGATYAIIGHSERRAVGDTDAIVAKKLAHALTQGLTPILCIGESEHDDEGRYLAVVREELTRAIEPLAPKERTEIIIAYEPLWAIGKNASAAIKTNDLTEMVLYIRKILAELLPGKSSAHSLVLYGGSVESGNIRALAATSGVDGFLVGHESVDPHAFTQLVKQLDQHQIRFDAGRA
ncbi:triose-phosphate isomerase [Candidatus Kaiserbacteria bacterium RIFOXYD1_FULL_47_14]|uniref:Triosephosphate isomerase n=1 Tax=Candidatus Kaiserbacteria bacterium RIFOXYD1_FULL_47_14 TaxID=1798533 RepID=A0A1F6G447_9BACT|nr:MAG: triose-phosphate isomerase [Candidatus Kaiserbacteria bacterium RIFOXYD1_FULL_47_14]